jgi:hypothetical protein
MFELVTIKGCMTRRGQDLFLSLDEIKFPLFKKIIYIQVYKFCNFFAHYPSKTTLKKEIVVSLTKKNTGAVKFTYTLYRPPSLCNDRIV